MFKLAQLLPLERLLTAARNEALRVCERWDVPRGKDTTDDLRDIQGRYMLTSDGYRVSGLLLDSDMQHGSDSAAMPLLLAMFPILAAILPLATSAFGIAGAVVIVLAIVVVAFVCTAALGLGGALGALVIGAIMPMVGAIAPMAVGGLGQFDMSTLMKPLLIAGVVLFLFNKNPTFRLLAWGGGFLIVLSIADFMFSAMFRIPPGATLWLAACLLPIGFVLVRSGTRGLALANQGNTATIASSAPFAATHITARAKQAQNALKDSTTLVQLGKTKGIFTGKMDPYAPDVGLPFCMSIADMDTHLGVFGSTGTGKTSAVLKPLVIQCRRALEKDRVGMVLLDGKGSLPSEFAGMRGYTLVEPGKVSLGLIEGLEPTSVVLAFMQINQPKTESGSGAFFTKAAGEMLRHFAVFLRALVDVEQKLEADGGEPRRWHWCVQDLLALGIRAQRSNKTISEKMDGYVEVVRNHHAEAKVESTLADAIEYITLNLPGMDAETRANVWETLRGWITPVMSHPELRAWASVERGVSLDEVFTGGAIGVSTPEVKFGVGGSLVQSLVKQRLFSHIRKRASYDWRAAGEMPVMFIVDEAQEIIGTEDRIILPIARSLGAICVYATQNIENYIVRLGGAHETHGFLDCFQSAVCFKSSPATMQWLQTRLGQTMTLVPSAAAGHVAYEQNARTAAEGPMSDPGHANSWLYRMLVRQGAGGTVLAHRKKGLLRHASAEDMDIDKLALNTAFIRQAELKLQPLLLDSEYDAFTAEKFVAIAQVQRGGVRRRDVILTDPMFQLPADVLRDEDEHETRAAPKRAEPVVDNGPPDEGDEESTAARERTSHAMRPSAKGDKSKHDALKAREEEPTTPRPASPSPKN